MTVHNILAHILTFLVFCAIQLDRYDHWITTISARPLVGALAITSTIIVFVLIPSRKQWTRSVAAFTFWKVIHMLCWNYFLWVRYLMPEGFHLHAYAAFVQLFIVSGFALIVSIFGKYFLGWEDHHA